MQSYIPNLPFLLVALLVVLLAPGHPQASIAPARKDSRASSLQWMPDVAHRRDLLDEYLSRAYQQPLGTAGRSCNKTTAVSDPGQGPAAVRNAHTRGNPQCL